MECVVDSRDPQLRSDEKWRGCSNKLMKRRKYESEEVVW
jgi:hypothetical protein